MRRGGKYVRCCERREYREPQTPLEGLSSPVTLTSDPPPAVGPSTAPEYRQRQTLLWVVKLQSKVSAARCGWGPRRVEGVEDFREAVQGFQFCLLEWEAV